MDEHVYPSRGIDYQIRVGTGREFSGEMEHIIAFLIPRAHVKERYLRQFVPCAQFIGLAKNDEHIVSVCALKEINCSHSASVRNESGYPLRLDIPELEYAATDEHHVGRGLGRHLNEQIIVHIKGEAFATIRVGNVDEERNIRRCHFGPVGKHGDRVDEDGRPYQIGLWIRSAGAPADCDGSPESDA